MSCDKCNDTGWIIYYDELKRSIAKECTCRGRMIAEARLKNSGMQEIFQGKTLDNFDGKHLKALEVAKVKARDYIDNFEKIERKENNSVLFVGQVGAGKTHLTLAIGNALLNEKGVSVVYMPYRETMSNLKQWEYNDKHLFDEQMHKYSYCRLLIIDDLFKGRVDERELSFMFTIVNQRYLSKLPIICSSEKTNIQLLDIDEAIGSRLIDMARGHSVLFEGLELNHRVKGLV